MSLLQEQGAAEPELDVMQHSSTSTASHLTPAGAPSVSSPHAPAAIQPSASSLHHLSSPTPTVSAPSARPPSPYSLPGTSAHPDVWSHPLPPSATSSPRTAALASPALPAFPAPSPALHPFACLPPSAPGSYPLDTFHPQRPFPQPVPTNPFSSAPSSFSTIAHRSGGLHNPHAAAPLSARPPPVVQLSSAPHSHSNFQTANPISFLAANIHQETAATPNHPAAPLLPAISTHHTSATDRPAAPMSNVHPQMFAASSAQQPQPSESNTLHCPPPRPPPRPPLPPQKPRQVKQAAPRAAAPSRKPAHAKLRAPGKRSVRLVDYLKPVLTNEEVALFFALHHMHSVGRKTDWIAFATAWNMHLNRLLLNSPKEAFNLYLKTPYHLQQFGSLLTSAFTSRDAQMCRAVVDACGAHFPSQPHQPAAVPSSTTADPPAGASTSAGSHAAQSAAPSIESSTSAKLGAFLALVHGAAQLTPPPAPLPQIQDFFGRPVDAAPAAQAALLPSGTSAGPPVDHGTLAPSSLPSGPTGFLDPLSKYGHRPAGSTIKYSDFCVGYEKGSGKGGSGSMRICWACTFVWAGVNPVGNLVAKKRALPPATVVHRMCNIHQDACPFCKKCYKGGAPSGTLCKTADCMEHKK